MNPARVALAVAATTLAGVAVVQLARVDADVGAPLGPDRAIERGDARTALASRPIDGRAFRLLGLLEIASARAPRDVETRARSADAAFADGDVAGGMQHLDAMFRVAPETAKPTLALLMPHLQDARVRDALVAQMSADPPWRGAVFRALREDATPAGDAAALLAELDARHPLNDVGQRARVAVLDRAGQYAQARAAWRALSSVEGDAPVFDGGFEIDDAHDGYGWRIDDQPGVAISYEPRDPHAGESALSIDFSGRAARFSAVHQSLALAPGHYRFEAWSRGDVVSARPFEWRLDCRRGKSIAKVALAAPTATWQRVATDFDVPSDCTGQWLVLVHASRSLAEQVLHGSLSIDDVRIFLIGESALREGRRDILSTEPQGPTPSGEKKT